MMRMKRVACALLVGLGMVTVSIAITGALYEVNARNRREAMEINHRENERGIDEPMKQQSMFKRIYRRHTRMVPLEV